PQRLPELVLVTGVELDARVVEGLRVLLSLRREEQGQYYLVEPVARKRRVRGTPDKHGARQHLPTGAFIEGLERTVAREDAQVRAAVPDRVAPRDDEPAAVALAALGLVRDDGTQAAGGVALTPMRDLLRQDVERGHHPPVVDQQHRYRPQRRV